MSGNSKQRRINRRAGERAGVLPVIKTGDEVKIVTEDAGKTYRGVKGMVTELLNRVATVQTAKRKAPLTLRVDALAKAA